jgi:hypothetical protein
MQPYWQWLQQPKMMKSFVIPSGRVIIVSESVATVGEAASTGAWRAAGGRLQASQQQHGPTTYQFGVTCRVSFIAGSEILAVSSLTYQTALTIDLKGLMCCIRHIILLLLLLLCWRQLAVAWLARWLCRFAGSSAGILATLQLLTAMVVA